jgi:hypothetical protein
MPSGQVTWLIGAAIIACAGAFVRYGLREERVPGRLAPAVAWGLGLYLLLAGPFLPPLRSRSTPPSPDTLILDVSASMDLPVAPGGSSRIDSALVLVRALSPDLLILFGSETTITEAQSADTVTAAGIGRSGSRLAPALRIARAAGADSVLVVTDGEIEDREDARREAGRLGLGVREIQTASRTGRTTIRDLSHPQRVSAGDTINFVVELWTPTGPDRLEERGSAVQAIADSVSVTVTGPDAATARVRAERPAEGRSRIVRLRLPATAARGVRSWQRFELTVDSGADPIGPRAARVAWIDVAPTGSGPVIVSVDPDWEPGHLLPVLTRASARGARAYVRVESDLWVRSGTSPAPVPAERVRAEAVASDLLVVQGTPGDLPSWLANAAARHDRLMFLARGPGEVPGTELSVGGAVEGEWFADLPPPPSPVARVIAGLDADALPPVFALRGFTGPASWPILEFRRDRRGDSRPGAVGIRSPTGRRAVVLAEGMWRWSARTGSTRAVYRALYAGIAAWLLEDFHREPVALASGENGAATPVGWEVAPGVSDLVLMVRDSLGSEIWRDSVADPGVRVGFPDLPAGNLAYEARGTLDGSDFSVNRPFTIARDIAELAGRPVGNSLTTGAVPATGGGPAGPWNGRGRPVWPFALAGFLFCAEWYLRRRLGLR